MVWRPAIRGSLSGPRGHFWMSHGNEIRIYEPLTIVELVVISIQCRGIFNSRWLVMRCRLVGLSGYRLQRKERAHCVQQYV